MEPQEEVLDGEGRTVEENISGSVSRLTEMLAAMHTAVAQSQYDCESNVLVDGRVVPTSHDGPRSKTGAEGSPSLQDKESRSEIDDRIAKHSADAELIDQRIAELQRQKRGIEHIEDLLDQFYQAQSNLHMFSSSAQDAAISNARSAANKAATERVNSELALVSMRHGGSELARAFVQPGGRLGESISPHDHPWTGEARSWLRKPALLPRSISRLTEARKMPKQNSASSLPFAMGGPPADCRKKLPPLPPHSPSASGNSEDSSPDQKLRSFGSARAKGMSPEDGSSASMLSAQKMTSGSQQSLSRMLKRSPGEEGRGSLGDRVATTLTSRFSSRLKQQVVRHEKKK